MKRNYVVIYLSADGKYYNDYLVSSVSFSGACKSAKEFSKHAGVTIMGVIEEKTLSQNFISSFS